MARKKTKLTDESLPAFAPEVYGLSQTAPAIASCNNCPYWRQFNEQDGNCIAIPPSIPTQRDLTAHGPRVTFGVTTRDTVCGQHPHFITG